MKKIFYCNQNQWSRQLALYVGVRLWSFINKDQIWLMQCTLCPVLPRWRHVPKLYCYYSVLYFLFYWDDNLYHSCTFGGASLIHSGFTVVTRWRPLPLLFCWWCQSYSVWFYCSIEMKTSTVVLLLVVLVLSEQALGQSWWDRLQERARTGLNAAREHIRTGVEVVRQTAEDTGDRAREAAQRARELARQAAADTREFVKRKLEELDNWIKKLCIVDSCGLSLIVQLIVSQLLSIIFRQ